MKYRIYRVNLIGTVNNASIDYRDKKTNTYFDFLHEKDAKEKANELNNRVEHPDIEYWYRLVEG